jgi:hypothetical protein
MRGYQFTENEPVAHIGNLKLKMFVIRLLWKYIPMSTGKVAKKTLPGEHHPRFEKEVKKHFDGLQVQWWEGDNLKKGKFHAEQIVPWAIAEQGLEKAEEWIQEMK